MGRDDVAADTGSSEFGGNSGGAADVPTRGRGEFRDGDPTLDADGQGWFAGHYHLPSQRSHPSLVA